MGLSLPRVARHNAFIFSPAAACVLVPALKEQILQVSLMELHSRVCLRERDAAHSGETCSVDITKEQGELSGAPVTSTSLHSPSRTSLLPEQLWLKQ